MKAVFHLKGLAIEFSVLRKDPDPPKRSLLEFYRLCIYCLALAIFARGAGCSKDR